MMLQLSGFHLELSKITLRLSPSSQPMVLQIALVVAVAVWRSIRKECRLGLEAATTWSDYSVDRLLRLQCKNFVCYGVECCHSGFQSRQRVPMWRDRPDLQTVCKTLSKSLRLLRRSPKQRLLMSYVAFWHFHQRHVAISETARLM